MIDKQLASEAGKQRGLLALVACLGIGGGVLAVVQAYYLTQAIDQLFLGKQELAAVAPVLGLLAGLALLRAGVMYGEEIWAFRLAAEIKATVRQRLTVHVLGLGPVTMAQQPAGEVINILHEGIENLDAYFSKYLPQLLKAAVIPVLVLLAVGPLDHTSAVIMLITAPLIPVFMILIGKLAEKRNARQWETLNRLSAHFLDVLAGLTTLKLFGRSREQIAVIIRVSNEFRDATMAVLRVAFLSALTLELIATISTALVAVTVGLRLLAGSVTFTQALFVLLLAPEYYQPLRLLGSQFHAGMAGKTAAADIFRLLALNGPSTDKGSAPVGPQQRVAVEFREVYAEYEHGRRPALAGISFTLAAGRHLAVVGPSGAGKSTLAALLLKFLAQSTGEILVNGQVLSTLHTGSWLRQVAFVPQRPHLFQGSVADNIKLARPDAAFDEVVAAAKAAGAHEFIMRLAKGYYTEIGEGGQAVSGGERQRLAIARAFLQNAPLVILDEAARGLDVNSQAALDAALTALLKGRTAVIIAHRLTTVRQADKIMVLTAGQIAEFGTPAELLARDGEYSRLVSASQAGGAEHA
ncbi:thiol reductant ABC exporter subunit CydD [Sporomusa acidovorans]|uniref:ATP-binding/permease protein CydD n=1 Tax=Sporomusa acidovorans (strain ATCC 49682 / DSM 3132 / Mol) TaxID=1123286 RepID=A0ABZ3IW70_SPOA4|nr:thiol reductant ABC exporter subunit CydD [Sporomusa acidovorans]OZC17978.1 ATP-binding/permease protein CydD [Sporomusa acidovorans DSM 3132]SDF41963.1 ATP-binding cassette, subfamily C, CydD [Sporomusa acidovorans]